jgi:hypothetical protein
MTAWRAWFSPSPRVHVSFWARDRLRFLFPRSNFLW